MIRSEVLFSNEITPHTQQGMGASELKLFVPAEATASTLEYHTHNKVKNTSPPTWKSKSGRIYCPVSAFCPTILLNPRARSYTTQPSMSRKTIGNHCMYSGASAVCCPGSQGLCPHKWCCSQGGAGGARLPAVTLQV